jgi:hypothetical protein
MKDNELELLTDWHYCNVTAGDKTPYPFNWNNQPLKLSQVSSSNIGLQLGEHSNGTCAIDFDGSEAIDYWNQHFAHHPIDQFNTVMWTSGKEYRLQAAFRVPQAYWSVLKRKVVNKLEFRWGGQSVLPPSKLNDGRQYYWIKPASQHQVQTLMPDVLEHWLQLILNDITKYDNIPQKTFELTNFDEEFVNILLDKISHKVGNLRGDYDVWRTIAWACCSAVGMQTAKMLMQFYWPEKTLKEMQTLISWKSGVGPTIGTLIKMSGIGSLERQLLETQMKLRKMKEQNGTN